MSSKGYIKNHDALDFFNLRNFGACRNISDELLISPLLVEETVRSFAAARLWSTTSIARRPSGPRKKGDNIALPTLVCEG